MKRKLEPISGGKEPKTAETFHRDAVNKVIERLKGKRVTVISLSNLKRSVPGIEIAMKYYWEQMEQLVKGKSKITIEVSLAEGNENCVVVQIADPNQQDDIRRFECTWENL